MSNGNSDKQRNENLSTVYRELCSSYRAIDDFRTKLLGFLPLATGAGLFFLVTDQAKLDAAGQYLGPVGVFGFVITLGLFFYEFYGIKKCGALISAGKVLERELHIWDGQFLKRPDGVLGFINEPFAAGVIYPAVLGAWMFVGLHFSGHKYAALRVAPVIFFVGFAVSFFYVVKDKLKRSYNELEC